MLDQPELRPLETEADPTGSAAAGGHRLVRCGSGLILLEAACASPPPSGTATLTVEGRPLAPPSTAMLLGGQASPRIFFAARDTEGLLRAGVACEIARGGATLASFNLDPPAAAAPMLLDRAEEERAALLRFLLLTCGPLLHAGSEHDFAAACHTLARSLARHGAARALCRPGATLSFWAVPRAARGAWQLLERERIRRIEAPAEGVLAIPGQPPAPDALLLPPGAARPLPMDLPAARLPRLRDFLAGAFRGEGERRGASARALAALGRDVAAHNRWAGLLREVQLLAPARPHRELDPVSPVGGALELALADGAGGLFLCGWLRDPLALVAGLELVSPFGHRAVDPALLHRVPRPDLAERFSGAAFGTGGPSPGFVAHLPKADHPAVAQWRLALRLASGEAMELVAPPSRMAAAAARDLVLRAVHPAALRPGLLEGCVAPAVWHLHRAAMADTAVPEVVAIGTGPRRARAALVVPLWRNLRFLRFQLAAFARVAAVRQTAEIVYVLDSPEQRGEVEHLLRGMATLHAPLALTLVVMPANRGYASACNAGAAASSAPVLGFLNSDVLPAAPGWLDALLGRLRRERRLAAVGPKLLFDDGAIQHAGLLFRRGLDGQWLNDHYFKGFPRATSAANAPRRVPGVTGAALFVRRPAFGTAGGFCADYVIGDFEDSDLCLALRAAGHEIGYEPSAELFHFERQSIADHAGHARTLAGAYNRLLHHRRWDPAIAALMARFGEG